MRDLVVDRSSVAPGGARPYEQREACAHDSQQRRQQRQRRRTDQGDRDADEARSKADPREPLRRDRPPGAAECVTSLRACRAVARSGTGPNALGDRACGPSTAPPTAKAGRRPSRPSTDSHPGDQGRRPPRRRGGVGEHDHSTSSSERIHANASPSMIRPVAIAAIPVPVPKAACDVGRATSATGTPKNAIGKQPEDRARQAGLRRERPDLRARASRRSCNVPTHLIEHGREVPAAAAVQVDDARQQPRVAGVRAPRPSDPPPPRAARRGRAPARPRREPPTSGGGVSSAA